MRNKLIVMLMVIVAMMFATSGMVYAGLRVGDDVWDGDGITVNGGDVNVNGGQYYQDGELIGQQGEPGEDGVDGINGRDAKERKNQAGVGVDALLWQSPGENLGFETQYKYDIRNKEHSVYGVMKLNLWGLIKR